MGRMRERGGEGRAITNRDIASLMVILYPLFPLSCARTCSLTRPSSVRPAVFPAVRAAGTTSASWPFLCPVSGRDAAPPLPSHLCPHNRPSLVRPVVGNPLFSAVRAAGTTSASWPCRASRPPLQCTSSSGRPAESIGVRWPIACQPPYGAWKGDSKSLRTLYAP